MTYEQKRCVLELHKLGYMRKDIAQLLEVNESEVTDVIK